VGSFWFQAEVTKGRKKWKTYGIEDCDKRGLSPKVFRVSIRQGPGYVGYISSFFNVPGLFGSVTFQSSNYIGVDCADCLMAAYAKWKNIPLKKNHSVASLVKNFPKINRLNLSYGRPDKTVTWGKDIKSGDILAVRFKTARAYQHVGALFKDQAPIGVLDGNDLVINAGPHPLVVEPLAVGSFDGHVLVLRPE
jgi:hypothetical protein